MPRGGTAEIAGIGPVDPGLLRDLLGQQAQHHGMPAGLGGVSVRRLCVDTTGQVIAVDPVAVPLARLLAASAEHEPGRSGSQPSTVQPGQLLATLLRGLPTPPPDTASYQPTAAQKRVVRARDPHCCFPGCRRPARASQLDHRDPWPEGVTSTRNLHPLCKHHHDLKHAGWSPHRHPDGSTTWISPTGRLRRTDPD